MIKQNKILTIIVTIMLIVITWVYIMFNGWIQTYYQYINLQRDIFIKEPHGTNYYNSNQYLVITYDINGKPKLIINN